MRTKAIAGLVIVALSAAAFVAMRSENRAGAASDCSWVFVHWRGALSGRQRSSLAPWRKRSPVT